MSTRQQRIVQAWLDKPDSGIIELSHDWTADALPPLTLAPKGPPFATLVRVPDHSFGRVSGYFVNSCGEIFFFLQLADHPEIDPASTAVYLAGDFNGWQHAVGDPAWRLLPASLDGEPALLHAERVDGFSASPLARFKFVTGEHHWLPVSSRAPNAVRDDIGNYNYAIDPARTGRHLFRFTTADAVDLNEAIAVAWADDPTADKAALRPGEFFFALKCHVPLGALVEDG